MRESSGRSYDTTGPLTNALTMTCNHFS